MSLYDLKPRFQALLRPLAARLALVGVTANQVTLAACAGSLVAGGLVALNADARGWFLLIAAWFPLRMAMNAVDGLLARDHGQKSTLGAYLNEVCDVISDAALYLPFAFVAPFDPHWLAAVVLLAIISEFAGVVGPTAGTTRRYDGPMGKSDRALVFGLLGLVIAVLPSLPQWLGWSLPCMALLLVLTVFNRIRGGVREHRSLPSARLAGSDASSSACD